MTAKVKKIVFLTGAGMSVESGFKTFRGADGLWENFPVQQVATHEGWLADPTLVTNFYNDLRQKLFLSQPNEGHRLIAQLESRFRVTVVTQNVDNLHERAGSSRVIHLHGELAKVCSSADPYNPRFRRQLTSETARVVPGTLAEDGSLLRPFIVFFGEAVPMIEPAIEETIEADVFVVVGTSLNVYPAAGLLHHVPPQVPVFIIDPDPISTRHRRSMTQLQMGASQGMRELTDRFFALENGPSL